MYYYPYYLQNYQYIMNREEASAYIRILHASPNSPPVDVYANGNLIARNLAYRNFTPFIKVMPGKYNIKVYKAGTLIKPVIDTNIILKPSQIYTAAARGKLADINLQLIPEEKINMLPDKANIRFVHLSPDSPPVDIALPNNKIIFSNVSYGNKTNYISVNPGNYTIYVKPSGMDKVVLTVPNIILKPNQNYSIYAIGLLEGNPKLQVLIPLDGNTYLY